MAHRRRWWLHRLPTFLLVIILCAAAIPASGLTPDGYFDTRLGALTGPSSFSLSVWTVEAFARKIGQMIGADPGAGMTAAEQSSLLEDFFALADDVNRMESTLDSFARFGLTSADPEVADLEGRLRELRATRAAQSLIVERILEQQIQSTLEQESIALYELGDIFLPPVFFKMIDLPDVLIVAYRDRFEMRTQVAVQRSITTQQTEDLENAVDSELNVRSLIVPIGGYSTYPTMVAGTAPRDFVLGAIAHEWCHLYLMLRPLGAAYGKDGRVTAMNETVCSIFGDDVAATVRETYYGAEKMPRPWQTPPTPTPEPAQPPREEPQGFNANRELRKIYLAAEERLKAGDIAGAEQIMATGRQTLADNDVYLRKLNQAFFAFYGAYAEGPDSIRPDTIGDDLRELRRRSASLKDFFETVAGMSSYDDLQRALGK